MQARHLMELAQMRARSRRDQADPSCPDADFAEVYAVVAKGPATRTIPKDQAELRRWEERWRGSAEFAPWPLRSSNAKDFVRHWRDAFRPLRDWVNACALCVAAEVQRAYRDFRFERGVVTYADQVALAVELMRRPDVARIGRKISRHRGRSAGHRSAAVPRPPRNPHVHWKRRESGGKRAKHRHAGAFLHGGRFRQSIYRDPADLARYRELHDRLIEDRVAEELKFSVTFRLDQAQLDFVNATFPEILNNCDGQVEFVELNARPDILPGQVMRLDLGHEVDLATSELQRAAEEARQLSQWLRAEGHEKLRAESWRQVAILSPRKAWLRSLRDALLAVGLPAEVQSESDLRAENPAYAWLTALLAIMVDPNATTKSPASCAKSSGLSDDELARFARAPGRVFKSRKPAGAARSRHFESARPLRLAIRQQPLFSAVQEIVHLTQLRERLRSLSPQIFPDLGAELDTLRSAAATAEARAVSLVDFASSLRTSYHAIRETNPSTTNAIQLITAHKAKGSEWQAVIVPFLTRKVHASPRYPSLIKPRGGPAGIVFDKADANNSGKNWNSPTGNGATLLYVALTRAKHTWFWSTIATRKANGTIHSTRRSNGCARTQWSLASISLRYPATAQLLQTAHRQRLVPRSETRENFGPYTAGLIVPAKTRHVLFAP
jgi:hypothetical protein